jgi:hypothetical protein
VVDGRLWWEVRIVPNDGSGVSYVAFVNARSTDVRAFSTTENVEQFLRSDASVAGTVGTNASGQGNANQASAPADSGSASGEGIVIQRVNENGTVVETVVVGSNESVRIVRSGDTNETDNGTEASGRLRPIGPPLRTGS